MDCDRCGRTDCDCFGSVDGFYDIGLGLLGMLWYGSKFIYLLIRKLARRD